jgi:hypothetical protein
MGYSTKRTKLGELEHAHTHTSHSSDGRPPLSSALLSPYCTYIHTPYSQYTHTHALQSVHTLTLTPTQNFSLLSPYSTHTCSHVHPQHTQPSIRKQSCAVLMKQGGDILVAAIGAIRAIGAIGAIGAI